MEESFPSAPPQGPSPKPARPGAGLFLCVALLALSAGGCRALVVDTLNGMLGLDTTTYTERRNDGPLVETRDWNMDYRESIRFVAAEPDTRVAVNGKPAGLCPVVVEVSRGQFEIEEAGFYDAWRLYEVTRRKRSERIINEKYLGHERITPTRWNGRRAVTPSFSPVVIEWIRDDQPVATLTLPTPVAGNVENFGDPVARAALNRLVWNNAGNEVPGLAVGQRELVEGGSVDPSPAAGPRGSQGNLAPLIERSAK